MWNRIKKWFTIDHVVDLLVDIALIIYEVISSPILIVMLLLRHFVGEWFTGKIKAGVRWVAHWFERKRAYRLEHGIGIFRTYWWLILLSPIIITASVFGFMILAGVADIVSWIWEEIEYDFFYDDDV